MDPTDWFVEGIPTDNAVESRVISSNPIDEVGLLNAKLTVTKADLEEIIRTSEKKRHEIVGDKIRALYGHSVPQFIKKEEGVPPKVLYHGTTKEALGSIKKNGLVPMQRQYVHLSVDREMADSVARRKKKDIAILRIDTEAARKDGIKFYIGNDKVWLAEHIPTNYISVEE